MPQPLYAAFTGNTLKFLPLTPYRGIIPEGTVINGFPDGIRGSVGVKLVKIEDGTFERVYVDLDGVKNTEYYPVKVTTADIGDGRIREHLTNDEECLWLNDLLDGPEKYLRGEFEKTRRNEPARFVFMRKFEYPDDMYEIHNPRTEKCNVFDASSGQLMFPDWCDAVEFKDGKWSRSNAPKLEGIDALAQAFVEGITEKDLALDRYLKGMQADVPPQPEGVAGSAQAYYYMLGRKPNETADLLSAVAKASAPEIEKALGPGTHEVAEKLAKEMEPDYNGLKPDMLERAASLYREGKVADGFREARGAMEDFAFNHMCYAVSKVWNTDDDKGSLSVDSSLGRRVVRNTWLVHGTTPESAVSIAKRGFDRGNKIGMLAYNLSAGADGQKHDYSGDYLFAFDAGDDIHGSGETSVDLDKYGDALVVFKGSGYKVFHHGDNEYQVIFDYHEPKACFLVSSSSAAAELGFPVRKAGENAMAIYNDQVYGQKDGQPVPLFAAQHANDCVEWIVAHGDQYRNFMFRWGTGENKNMTEGISMVATAFVESASDGRMLRIATDIATQFFSGDTLKQIVDKLNDMESLSVFGKDEDFYVTKEIKEPVHLVIQAFLGYDPSHEQRSGVTFYGNPPKITLYLSDTTGRLRGSYNKAEHVRDASAQDVIQRWKSTAIHEIAHALDQVLRGSTNHGRNTKSSLRQTGDYRYANDLLETNARIPQIARMMCENLIARREFDGNSVPPIQTILKFFNDSIMSFSAMSEDTRKRTMKRIHDIYSKIAPVWKAHADEIKDADDFMKFLGGEGKDTCGIGDILGKGATVQLANGSVLKMRRESDGTYTVIGGSYEGDVGTKITFDPKASYDPHLKTKALRTVKVERKDGKVYNSLPLTAKSVTPLNEGIDALAVAFVENVQTRITREEDLEKYAVEVKLKETKPEKKTGLVLVPADLVAIVARRMQASAEYDGLNYVIDPEGLTLHLDNGYMTGELSYDTHKEALVSPSGDGAYPLDDNTDLDWITKKILADMDPERFEEKIAGKYDEGRDLVATLAGSLRAKAERMGRKFRFREDGYKLSVENKETGDNYSSTVLEYDPEAKELKGKDGGSSFSLDAGTNIRKLASEIFNRTETMDL
jgi:hypothetical protein